MHDSDDQRGSTMYHVHRKWDDVHVPHMLLLNTNGTELVSVVISCSEGSGSQPRIRVNYLDQFIPKKL